MKPFLVHKRHTQACYRLHLTKRSGLSDTQEVLCDIIELGVLKKIHNYFHPDCFRNKWVLEKISKHGIGLCSTTNLLQFCLNRLQSIFSILLLCTGLTTGVLITLTQSTVVLNALTQSIIVLIALIQPAIA